jgi:glycosyltransferase involved in cell wall biosynthesis
LKIVVNTRLLLKNRLEGIGWFSYETLKRIVRNHPEHEFIFVFDRAFDAEFVFSDNVTPVVLFPPTRHPVLQYIWSEISMVRLLKKHKPDLFLSPDGFLSLRTKTPSVAVIHDLNFEHYPKDVKWSDRKFYRRYFPLYARKAKRIATVSHYSKQDLINCYGIDSEKIDVTCNGVNEFYLPLSREEVLSVRENLTGGAPYFIYIGALRPRKNLKTLFSAFDAYRKEHPEAQEKLVIVGNQRWHGEEMKRAYEAMEYRNQVIFTGSLTPDQLRMTLGAALALTYVSYFEGFGIPIVEAFQAGVPVITSNITSMPEVAGDAALLIDPFNPASITQAMQQMTTDETLRKTLIEKGHQRQKLYTWDKAAELLWNCVEKSLTV